MDAPQLPTAYTWPAARAAGLTRAQLRDDGVRVTRGAYVSRSVDLTVRQACLAAGAVLPASAVFSHLTAAASLEAPVAVSWPLSVVVPPGVYRPRRVRLRVHVRELRDEDITTVRGVRVTSGSQTWLDLAATLHEDELVAVGDAFYRAGHLDATRLGERLTRASGTRGIAVARKCAPLLTPLAMSRPESLFRYWVIVSELPDARPHVPVHDRFGTVVAHADLGYEEWKIAIEYEGRQHAERRQFERDIERYSLMAADGWLTLRFGRRHLRMRETVIGRVAAALRSRGATW